jgi:hypothetical protein
MKEDPIVEEIHDVRNRLLEEAGGDLKALMLRLRASEARDQDKLVSQPQ